jgi:hypothetical protein
MDQKAIDAAIREANAKFPDEPPLYTEGSNACHICDFGIPQVAGLMQVLEEATMGFSIDLAVKRIGHGPIKRICFKDLK